MGEKETMEVVLEAKGYWRYLGRNNMFNCSCSGCEAEGRMIAVVKEEVSGSF